MEIVFGYGVAIIFGFVIGVVVFYFYSMGSGSSKDTSALEALEQEHTDYQQKVDSHFVETAELFKDLTDRYRAVYTHMAKGADGLCSEEVKQLQTELGNAYLLADEAEATEKAEPVLQPEAVDHETSEQPAGKSSPTENAEAEANEAPKETPKEASKEASKEAESSTAESDVPLASEVEVPPELRNSKK